MQCCICRENYKNFVTFECLHKVCLKCYNACIYHNHHKCSLCREEIPEIKNITKLIDNLKGYIEELKEEIEKLEEKMLLIDGINEELNDRNEELWAQIN